MKVPLGLPAGLVCACALWMLPKAAWSQPLGTTFTYQGELRVSGVPATGLYDLRFRLYDGAAGGAQVGPTLCSNNISLAGGRFTVDLDFLAVFTGQQRFLEIDVRPDTGLDCSNAAGFSTLAPRQPLTAAPHAVFALSAAAATTAANAAQLNGQSGGFYQNTANLSSGTIADARLSGSYTGALTLSNAANAFTGSGAGLSNLNASSVASGSLADSRLSSNVALLNSTQTFGGAKTFSAGPSFTAAGAPFTVSSQALVTNLNADLLDGLHAAAFLQAVPNPLALSGSASYTIEGDNSSTLNFTAGVRGDSTAASGATYGVYGTNSSNGGVGTVGLATSTSGLTYGVAGQSDSSGGIGVSGVAGATSGTTFGGSFQSNSSGGTGVRGIAGNPGGTTYGGYFQDGSSAGTGALGLATATSGVTYGVVGKSQSPSGNGVLGENDATTGTAFGVYGFTFSTGGRGVVGEAGATTGATYGVWGLTHSATGYGVFSNGNTGATGTKSFRIDHPADPTGKYLLHYSVESPEVLNTYSGKATLDGNGQAVVELPAYFASINKDPRYTLTALGAPMPMLHIAQEIDESALSAGASVELGQGAPLCTFRIAGGVAGARVSWEVKALRNDRWVQQHGAPVEVEKQGSEKGTYQHPDLYGQPRERTMHYDAVQAADASLHPPSGAAPR